MPPKRKPTTGQASQQWVLLVSMFIDSAAMAAGISTMALQGKHVAFSSGAALALFQLCYVVPQMISTPLAESLARTHSPAKVLLPLTLLLSAVSAALACLSFALKSLPFFYLSRAASGVGRHPKLLFDSAQSELVGGKQRPLSRYTPHAMHLGLLLGALVGDLSNSAITVQVCVVVAHCMASVATYLCAFRAAPRKTAPPPPSMPAVSTAAARSLLSAPFESGNAPVWALLCTFAALRGAAGVVQCMYPLDGPALGLPFVLTAGHLILQDLIPTRIVAPFLASSRMTSATTRHWVTVAAALLLVAGVVVVPLARKRGTATYYSVTFALVDVPAAVVQASLMAGAAAIKGAPATVLKGLNGGLLIYVLIAAKIFSAPLLVFASQSLTGWRYPVYAVSVPLAVQVLGTVVSGRCALGLAAAAGAASYLVSGQSVK